MVAGNHDRANSGFPALLNCRLDLGTNGVDHAGQAQITELLLQVFRLIAIRRRLPASLCAAKDSQSLIRHGLIGSQNFLTLFLGHGQDFLPVPPAFAAAEHLVRRALGELNDGSLRHPVYRRHHLSSGVKGRFSNTGIILLHLGFRQPQCGAVVDQRALRGFTLGLTVSAQNRIRAQLHGQRQPGNICAVVVYHGHFILGQGAGFIRADDLRAAQSFHCGELTDNGLVGGHFRHTDGQYNGYHCGQALRNCRHRKAHRHHKRIQQPRAGDIGIGPDDIQ